jgi:hypothetical protein
MSTLAAHRNGAGRSWIALRKDAYQFVSDRYWRILLKKLFWGDEQNFSGPLIRFARGNMRDHIVLCKNDHGASYRLCGVLQWWSRLKISICEIFWVVRFSTFSTVSAHSGRS